MTQQEPNYRGDAPLFSADVKRRELHNRRINFQGYSRDDGLYQVEAHLIDSRPAGSLQPDPPTDVTGIEMIHDLGVDVVFGSDMVVRAVRTLSRTYPYRECPSGGDALQAIVGLCIGPGWSSEVRKRLPSSEVCAHLKEILIPLASAAFQTMTFLRIQQLEAVDATGKPLKVDSCYAYGASRELVLQRWPAFYRPGKEANAV